MLDLFEMIWLVIGLVALGVELIGLFFENQRRGIEPLTRILRDRLARHHPAWLVAELVFWLWLGYHFFHWLV